MNKPNAERAFPLRVVEQPSDEGIYDDGYLRVEHENYYLACGGQPVYLPRVEFLLMSRLTRSIDRVARSEELWHAAWGDSKPLNSASLQVYIHRLRANLALQTAYRHRH